MANLSNINDKFIVTDGGNVLIGTTADVAAVRLQVKNAGAAAVLRLTGGSDSWDFDTYYTDNKLFIKSSGAAGTVMTLLGASGNVGIGTPTPDLGGVAGTRVLTIASPTAERWGILELAGNRTYGGNQVGELKFISTDATNSGVLVSLTAINDPSATGTGGSLKFSTRADGGSLTERMRITSDGNTTFTGTVTAPRIGIPSANASFAFYNDNNSYFNGAVTVDSTFTQTGGAASTFSGQVTTSQPNSGLDYPVLIGLGGLGSGIIGYQTREQFNNATLQKWYNVDAANAGSSQWVKLGTLSNFGQGGYTFCLTFFGHTGYNASNAQDFNCKLFMKTSNGGGSGARFNTWVENTGANASSPAFKLINTDSSGTPTVGGSSFEIYMNVPAYANGSIYAINKWGGDWTSQNTTGQTDPGANSSTVLQAENIFNIFNTNVGIGTGSPGAYKLNVQGGPALFSGSVEMAGGGAVYQGQKFYLDGGGDTFLESPSSNLIEFTTNGVKKMSITSAGEVKIGTTAGANAKLHVVSTAKDRKVMIEGNASNQGAANNITLVNHYPVVSAGTQLIIPFTSQGNLNSTTIIKIFGHSARFNSSDPRGFEATIQVGHLSQLNSVSLLSSSGTISGISVSGMNLIISFTTAYTNPSLSDGVYATINYMTNNISYSLQPNNIVMN